MKKEKKLSMKVEFKNAEIEVEDGNIIIVEYDKDGIVVEESNLLAELEELIGQSGISISFKKDELK